jgi:hypothetical protein
LRGLVGVMGITISGGKGSVVGDDVVSRGLGGSVEMTCKEEFRG